MFLIWPILSKIKYVLRILFHNMIYTVRSYDCCFTLGRYFAEYQLIEANNLCYSVIKPLNYQYNNQSNCKS